LPAHGSTGQFSLPNLHASTLKRVPSVCHFFSKKPAKTRLFLQAIVFLRRSIFSMDVFVIKDLKGARPTGFEPVTDGLEIGS
jgi:hypothetical protein